MIGFRAFIKANGLQLVTLGALICNLYLNQNYVRREDYNRDKESAQITVRTVEKTLDSVSTSIALLQEHRRTLDDHESRLRVLERMRVMP